MKSMERVLLAVALWAPVWVLAQQVTLEPSAAARCLTPGPGQRGDPEYPFVAFKAGEKGRVKVALEFIAGTAKPKVNVLEQEGGDSFVEAVRKHVATFRVPCLGETAPPAQLHFEYVFQPDGRKVVWDSPVDPKDASRAALSRCVTHVSGEREPEYPRRALQDQVQGRVLARARYTAPDKAPEVEVFSRLSANVLAHAIEDWVKGLRMPCYAGEPVSFTTTYIFRMDGEAYGFNPGLSFRQLLPLVKGVNEQSIEFDTTQMACPFDVNLLYRQPDMSNKVGQVGEAVAARRPLLDWLATMQLDLPKRTMDAVYGDTLKFTVPCIKLNLQPKEKT